MLPVYQKIIGKFYESGSDLHRILIRHSSQVARLALAIAREKSLDLPEELVTDTAMLHDIGIFRTHAPSIHCLGSEPYICHGVIGAALLRAEGVDERIARVAERHTGAGLSRDDIIAQDLPLPHRDFLPESPLELLICYADKFFSKSGLMLPKPIAKVRAQMQAFGPDSLRRFDHMHSLFGDPDFSQASES